MINGKMIFTIAYSREEANEIGHFIRSRGYDGVQNDSYRYCDMMICAYLEENERHDRSYVYVGVDGGKMIVAKSKKYLRSKGLIYVEKKRKFYELLNTI